MTPELRSPLLVLGGAKSGKSAYAESMLDRFEPPLFYLATAQVLDEEMKERVESHRLRRKGRWETIECPFLLPSALAAFEGKGRPVLVDCITLWLSNLLCYASGDPESSIDELCDVVAAADHPLILVSNEVGEGIVPDNALARRFRDLAGSANQALARACASVTLLTAGLPLHLK